jgi:hypothetical protein
MFNYDTLIDTYEKVSKTAIEKTPLTAEVKKNLIEGVEIQSVMVKSLLVHGEKTFKQTVSAFFPKAK